MPPAFTVTNRGVFAIAGPAMLANVTTPLLGVVATAAIGRLGDSAVLGGVAMAALVFDCMFWLFAFLRMGTIALTAQAYGAGDTSERLAVLTRGLMTAAAIGISLIALQVPLAALIVTRDLGLIASGFVLRYMSLAPPRTFSRYAPHAAQPRARPCALTDLPALAAMAH